jgi:hypothetical protein
MTRRGAHVAWIEAQAAHAFAIRPFLSIEAP